MCRFCSSAPRDHLSPHPATGDSIDISMCFSPCNGVNGFKGFEATRKAVRLTLLSLSYLSVDALLIRMHNIVWMKHFLCSSPPALMEKFFSNLYWEQPSSLHAKQLTTGYKHCINWRNCTWRKLSTDALSFGEKETSSLFLCIKSLFSFTCSSSKFKALSDCHKM